MTHPVCKYYVLIYLLACWTCCPTTTAAADSEVWVYSRHVGLYVRLFKDPNIPEPVKSQMRESFHRFAFEYWLDNRTKNNPEQLRDLTRTVRMVLHLEAKSPKDMLDPLGLLPHFKNGKVANAAMLQPVEGIDYSKLTESRYRELVGEFSKEYSPVKRSRDYIHSSQPINVP